MVLLRFAVTISSSDFSRPAPASRRCAGWPHAAPPAAWQIKMNFNMINGDMNGS